VAENKSESDLTSIAEAYQAYASLMNFAATTEDPSLGGQFLYVGELTTTAVVLLSQPILPEPLPWPLRPTPPRSARHNAKALPTFWSTRSMKLYVY